MTNLRQAAQQALVALEAAEELAGKHDAQLEYGFHQTITALRTALEQQAEPCIGKDPRCPCQDGDACHYKDCGDTKALPVPQEQEPSAWREMVVATLVREGINKHKARELADHFAAQPESCQTCVEIHSLLDADESMIIRNARDGYPEGRTPRELTLLERVKSLCTYAADWKRWCIEAQTPPAAQRPWVGLTPEDLAQIDTDEFWQVGNHMAIAMAVEDKLKERNK
jgi:hypothetical protein